MLMPLRVDDASPACRTLLRGRGTAAWGCDDNFTESDDPAAQASDTLVSLINMVMLEVQHERHQGF